MGPSAGKVGAEPTVGPRGTVARAELWDGAGPPRNMEIRDRPSLGRNPGTDGFLRRGTAWTAQPDTLGRAGAPPFHRQECLAGAARRRFLADGMACPAVTGSSRGAQALAAG